MMKSGSTFGLSVLIFGRAMGMTALAQSNAATRLQTSTTNAAAQAPHEPGRQADLRDWQAAGDAVERRLLGSHEPLCPQEVGKEAA